ncbi:MAG: T9SS type A sorting domain-containing protein [Bacteroidetes bacterium]|nr:T9SS type A sorting domain-containing protein [Bacteroidota bacterium]
MNNYPNARLFSYRRTLTVGGNSSTSATLSFQRNGVQNFSASGNTVSGNVDFLVRANSIFTPGNSIVNGRNFTLSASATLDLDASEGIASTGSLGSIQVSGTRTFNASGNYIYSGSSLQITGDGLPATVANLTINNPAGVTLSRTTAVSNILTLTSGKVTTGAYELQVTNSSTSAITGFSSSSYVFGNLRRSVLVTGSYDFPLGSATAYQTLNLTLTAAVGFTNVLGRFTSGNPENPSYPLTPITISGVDMFEFINAGYWSLTPNSPLTVGIFSVNVVETGYTNSLIAGVLYSLLWRPNSTTAWSSAGTHSDATQVWSGTSVTAKRTTLTTFGDFAIADGDFPAFSTVSLIAGTAGTIGATYLFPAVMRGVDAWAKIMDINNGAALSNIDDQSTGYVAAFQPFIDYAPNKDGYVEWMIYFKKTGTSTDTILRRLIATGVDVDGGSSGGQNIREYIQATMPTSYSLDAATTLTVTNVMGRYKALGSTATISSIDTASKQAMVELVYNNVSSISYRTGSQNNYSSTQTRQTSIYFRSFGLGILNIALPIKLVRFEGRLKNNRVSFDWETATEVNNDYFTIERSSDGENFERVTIVRGAGNSTTEQYYSAYDDNPLSGYSYYRLKQTDYDGHFTYSDVETIHNKGGGELEEAIDVKSVAPNPFEDHIAVNFICNQKGQASVYLVNSSGAIIKQTTEILSDGYNTIELTDLGDLPSGVYFITITIDDKKSRRKF